MVNFDRLTYIKVWKSFSWLSTFQKKQHKSIFIVFERFWHFWRTTFWTLFQGRIWPKSTFYPLFEEVFHFKRKNRKKRASKLRLHKLFEKFMQFRTLLHTFTFSKSKNRRNPRRVQREGNFDIFVTFVHTVLRSDFSRKLHLKNSDYTALKKFLQKNWPMQIFWIFFVPQ